MEKLDGSGGAERVRGLLPADAGNAESQDGAEPLSLPENGIPHGLPERRRFATGEKSVQVHFDDGAVSGKARRGCLW